MIQFPIERLLCWIRTFTDPRRKAGTRHPFETVLSISVCAVLCGCKGYRAIGAWSESLSREELIRFGSNRDTPPSEPTIRRLLQRIDANKFDREIGQWLLKQRLLESPDGLKGCAIAIDGKKLRGSHKGSGEGIHLISTVIHKEGVVIAQEEVEEKTNEIKHVKPLLDNVNIEGCVVTVDALHTQKEFANYLVEEKKADYLFTVKENQPTLLDDIKSLDLKKNCKYEPDFTTTDKGHGRLEIRRIWVSNEPEEYDCTDFPKSKQFFIVEREVERYHRGDVTHSVDDAYGVTSLGKEQASAQRLLQLNRGHWEIENRVHYVRDVTYDEDRCRIRTENGPRVMASIRNLAISLARMMGFRYITDANRAFTFCASRKEVFAMWGIW